MKKIVLMFALLGFSTVGQRCHAAFPKLTPQEVKLVAGGVALLGVATNAISEEIGLNSVLRFLVRPFVRPFRKGGEFIIAKVSVKPSTVLSTKPDAAANPNVKVDLGAARQVDQVND